MRLYCQSDRLWYKDGGFFSSLKSDLFYTSKVLLMVCAQDSPFILVDGSSYLYRAYYAFPSLTNSVGEQTGAIYGVLNMLRKLFLQYKPTHAAIVFDVKGQTFRNQLFEFYKLHRPPMPDNLQIQIEPLFSIIRLMGLPLITVPNVEADDVIGTLARRVTDMGLPVLISTIDKDMAQLVTSKVNLINIANNVLLDQEGVMNKYGVPPELIIDFLALMGDASDNIPGVPGIGKKTARALLKGLGGIDKLYSESEKIASLTFRGSKMVASILHRNKEIAYLSYQLASIRTDVTLDMTFEEFKIRKPFTEELLNLFKKYEFKNWIVDIQTEKWCF